MATIVYESINEDFAKCVYNGWDVFYMKKNGYINISKIIAKTKTRSGTQKYFNSWRRNDQSKLIIKELVEYTKLSEKELIIESQLYRDLSGTYVHMLLVHVIAGWASPNFNMKIGLFLMDWRKQPGNEDIYYNEMYKSITKPLSNAKTYEHEYRTKIALEEDGQEEVEVPTGFIDVLTPTKIIEVKQCNRWKGAFGQIIVYGDSYQEHQKWLYLFDHEDCDCEIITKMCLKHNIFVKYLDEMKTVDDSMP